MRVKTRLWDIVACLPDPHTKRTAIKVHEHSSRQKQAASEKEMALRPYNPDRRNPTKPEALRTLAKQPENLKS